MSKKTTDHPAGESTSADHSIFNGEKRSLNEVSKRDEAPWWHQPGSDPKPGPDAPLSPPKVEPRPAAVDPAPGEDILDEVHRFLGRFISYPDEHCHTAHALWIIHAHLMDHWDSTPRLAFLSPEPSSGKTRALEVTAPLVPNAIQAINATPSYMYRRIANEAAGLPTILFDEIDTIFGPKAKDHEDLRALINAGYRRGQMAGRCVTKGKKIVTEELQTFSALAMAGIGTLPDTILTRSVIVPMKRRAKADNVDQYRVRIHEPQGRRIRDKVAAWAAELPELDPDACTLPDEITDRDADIWEPLLMVADAAGGDWPERARTAGVYIVNNSLAKDASLGVRLLTDIWEVFRAAEAAANTYAAALSTQKLMEGLKAIEEAPWADLHGTGINPRKLAQYLKKYDIQSGTVREADGNTPKGYKRESFWDAWKRYTPELVTADNSDKTDEQS